MEVKKSPSVGTTQRKKKPTSGKKSTGANRSTKAAKSA